MDESLKKFENPQQLETLSEILSTSRENWSGGIVLHVLCICFTKTRFWHFGNGK
jgi:hypothetical protein